MVGEGLSERENLSQDLDVEKEPAIWKSEEGTFETGATGLRTSAGEQIRRNQMWLQQSEQR